MRFHTQQLLQVLARGGFDSRWVCDVFYDGVRQMQDVDLEDVKHTEDGTAKVQQSGSLTIIYQGRHGQSIAPKGVEDILSPFGTTLALYMLITDGPKFEARVPMGTFVVTDTPTIEYTSWSFRGQALSKGDRIGVTFKDPFYKVLRNRFDVPGVTPSLASCYDEIQRLTRLPVTRSAEVPDGTIPRALVYEEDRLDAVYELAKAVDAIPYMTADGTLSLRPNLWGTPVDEITAANAAFEDRVTPAHYGPWVEERRNLIPNPNPTAYAGSGWATSAAGLSKNGEWVEVTHSVAVGAYMFTDGFNEVLAEGDLVTLTVEYRVNATNVGQAATHVGVIPHIRTGNVYHWAAAVHRPIVVGQLETVRIPWVVPAGGIALDQLDIAVLSTANSNGGALVGTGWSWGVRRPTIERGHVAGPPFSGAALPTIGRNLFPNPRFVGMAGWSVTGGTGVDLGDGVAELTMTAASSNVLHPNTTWPGGQLGPRSAAYEVENVGEIAASLRVSFWDGAAYQHGPATPIAPGETALVAHTGYASASATMFQPRLHTTIAAAGQILRVSKPRADDTPTIPEYIDGRMRIRGRGFDWEGALDASASFEYYPDDRVRWLGTVNASSSVWEGREWVPEDRIRIRGGFGTLIRVKRGMSAEGVYNRVVVRAQGQQAGVLAAGEITEGPLRAANTGGLDSPFGRVPYFLSSQFITTPTQGQAEVEKWLPRVSRPQAVVLDIEEIVNPLREVGDVVTVKRMGEEFPGRVVKIQRSKAKTQTTSVLVVPSA